MHISAEPRQDSNTILTKCSKMTEEKYKRHGMNGNVDGSFKDESSKNSLLQGGRLKFFKDGKFILELERAREGERVSWVSVPRKTFWPPQGTAVSTPTYRQESSTSLSVSDDNSSIQSSPWQRDHSWKQSSPRRNQSKELSFFFWRPKNKRSGRKLICSTRRPYSAVLVLDKEKTVANNDERTNRGAKCGGSGARCCYSLLAIVQNLLERSSTSTSTSATATLCRNEAVVSPRKRFLREMEKDTRTQIEDGCQKRSRSKSVVQNQNSSVAGVVNNPQTCSNGLTSSVNAEDVKPTSRNCSYSITSLLSEDRNVKRSPTNSPSHVGVALAAAAAAASHTPHYCSPPPPISSSSTSSTTASEERWYSESVDRLRSIELSQAEKRGFSSYPHPSYHLPHYMYPYTLPPYYSPTNMYGRGTYMMPPAPPPPPPPPVYHTSSLPLSLRHGAPSCSWTADPPRDLQHNDDTITDMPLNLSKHAG